MKLADKLTKLRKDSNYTQEQLADILGVSRQSISKWESGLSIPETEKLIKLGELYNCSMDYLLKDSIESPDGAAPAAPLPAFTVSVGNLNSYYYEHVSRRRVFGMPLLHVNIGAGRTAKGFIAVGLKARGVISVGILSAGLISVGILSLGVISLGLLVLGLFAFGAIAVGAVAFGAIAIGIMTAGALSVGAFSGGALAIGKYFAIGYDARGMIAIGDEKFRGTLFAQKLANVSDAQKAEIIRLVEDNIPAWLKWCMGFVKILLGA